MDAQGISTLAIIAGLGLAAVGPGIGMGIAHALAKEGANIVINGFAEAVIPSFGRNS